MTSTQPDQIGPLDQASPSNADDDTIRKIDRAIAELRDMQEMCALIRKENERAQLAAE